MTEREAEIIGLIRKEVKPALGCTEPIAVALAVAKATEILEEKCGGNGGIRKIGADFRISFWLLMEMGQATRTTKTAT